MRSSRRSKVSYRAAISIFAVIATIIVVSGLITAKPSSAVAPEVTVISKHEARRGFSLEEWLRLAKTL